MTRKRSTRKTKKAGTPVLRKLSGPTVGKAAGTFALRCAGHTLGKAGSHNVTAAKKLHAPIMAGVGLLGEIFIENDLLRAPLEGIGQFGYDRLMNEVLPNGKVRDKLGYGSKAVPVKDASMKGLGNKDQVLIDTSKVFDELTEALDDDYDSLIPSNPVSGYENMDEMEDDQIIDRSKILEFTDVL